jgi:hypothetical protein
LGREKLKKKYISKIQDVLRDFEGTKPYLRAG